jgi:hypothetical protein
MKIKNLIPNVVIDGLIVSTLAMGAVFVLPKIVYSILVKEGVFGD